MIGSRNHRTSDSVQGWMEGNNMEWKDYVKAYREKTKQKEYKELESKAAGLRKDFIERFGIEALESMSGEDLLRKMFYSDLHDNNSMCYILETDRDYRQIFGSVKGGSAYKFELFYNNKAGSWVSGSPQKPRILTLDEAIIEGENIRDMLVEAAKTFSAHGTPSSPEDYTKIYSELIDNRLFTSMKIWVIKYFQMLFPEWFTTFYSDAWNLKMLNLLAITPADERFLRIGQVNLKMKSEGMDSVLFAKMYFENVEDEDEVSEEMENGQTSEAYSEDDFLNDVFMEEKDYRTLVSLLESKKNVILQGPPGVGKTFVAERLAWSIMGERARDRITTVQFHQNYTYEDFVMGYRPSEKGLVLKKGVFHRFCEKAGADDQNDYFIIIDEINRGNLSMIFGELMMLIEADKRDKAVKLLYSSGDEDLWFSVPPNLYIIGTMNNADRSLALMDYAMRRRFSFFDMEPAFDNDRFKAYAENVNRLESRYGKLLKTVRSLNDKISDDPSLGNEYRIGHSFLYINNPTNKNIRMILNERVEFDIIPLLREYWFDNKAEVEDWSSKLRESIQ